MLVCIMQTVAISSNRVRESNTMWVAVTHLKRLDLNTTAEVVACHVLYYKIFIIFFLEKRAGGLRGAILNKKNI
jgi:hypothetical protein